MLAGSNSASGCPLAPLPIAGIMPWATSGATAIQNPLLVSPSANTTKTRVPIAGGCVHIPKLRTSPCNCAVS